MKNIIAQFIPILIIFFLFTAIKPFILFSNTILGKLLAVFVIIFYTFIDKILGLFVCSLVILFYQLDYVEGMVNIEGYTSIDSENYLPDIDNTEESREKDDKNKYPKGMSAYRWMDYVDSPENSHITPSLRDKNRTEILSGRVNIQDEFRKENCKNGALMYKNNEVRKDMAEFVFPELKMNGIKCNPCDKTCSFSIVESKLKTEKELAPKSSWW